MAVFNETLKIFHDGIGHKRIEKRVIVKRESTMMICWSHSGPLYLNLILCRSMLLKYSLASFEVEVPKPNTTFTINI
jgi:hypothetical protein